MKKFGTVTIFKALAAAVPSGAAEIRNCPEFLPGAAR
jgi:hypothetical protein